MALYHKNLGFPKNISNWDEVKRFYYAKYSFHAQNAAENDRYGKILLPRMIDFTNAEIIEIETEGNLVIKCVGRIPYNKDFDLVVVIIPQNSFVKTVWLNSKTDKHLTLQKWRYTIPEK